MSSEESGPPPVEGPEGSGEMAIEKGPFGGEWDRRTLFKGAALGTAAAAMYAGGRMAFGPLTAFADDLSGLKCTANDVRIPAPGQILNEPCTCSGTFNAEVSFPIVNNTGTSRYCVTMHLCAGVDEDGNVVVPAQDIIVGTIPPNFDGTRTVTINNYPCGSGLVCFGATGPEVDGGFPKGAACPAGQCCTTVSWNVVANDACPDPGGVIKSKCRHQRICIQGRGETTIACPNNNCAVACGSSVGLTVCTTEPTSEGPFIFELRSGSTLVERFPTTGTTTDICHTFTVSPTADTTYFGRVISTQDDPDCVKDSPTVLVTVENITPEIAVGGGGACNTGALTLTATPTGCESYAWFLDDATTAFSTSNPASYDANPDNQCHTVRVDVVCDGCEGSASTTIIQCVTTTSPCS